MKFMLTNMEYPFIKCLNPKWINNRNTGERMLVGCGKCVSCRNLRSRQMSLKCNLESKYSPYTFFITLTYDETFVPCMVPVAIKGTKGQEHYFISTCQRLGEDGKMITHHPYRNAQLDELQKKIGTPYGIPYLSKRDAQLFLKRLRKNIKSYIDAHNFDQWNYNIQHGLDQKYKLLKNEKLRYFLCGEYGNNHLRPHFHILVWVSQSEISERMAEFVNQSWKFGITDCQLTEKNASSYVANYVNSVGSLPSLYQQGKCAPFALHSCFLGEKFYKSQSKEIYKLSAVEFVRRSERINDSVSEFVLWRSIKNTFYPRCREYASSSPAERQFLYTLYARFRGRKPTHRTPSGLAAEIINDAEYLGYVETLNNPNEIDIDRLSKYYDKLLNIHDNFVVFDRSQHLNEIGELSDESFMVVATRYAKHREYCYNFIYHDLALSKHFLDFVCNGSDNPVDIHCKLHMIDNFYQALDLANLNDQLRHQEIMLDNHVLEIDDIEYFYDGFDVVQFTKLPIYQSYKQYVTDMVDKRQKHKKQNDANRLLFHEVGLI